LTSFNLTRDEASTPAQLLVRITDLPLDFAPGTEFAYSSSGFVALGAIIEQVSGMSYEAFLQQEIFVPLGMHDTGYDTGNDGLATGYKDATTVADPIDPSVYFAAGALYSTVLDMHRWDQALYTDQLVPLGLLATMFKPAVTIPGAQGLAYGYGFFVGTSVDDPWAGHDGSIEGFETWYVRHSKNRLSVVFLSNREGDIGYEQLDRSITDLVLHR
jgi:CubicO group peptidase (beta-lactamase class C family)